MTGRKNPESTGFKRTQQEQCLPPPPGGGGVSIRAISVEEGQRKLERASGSIFASSVAKTGLGKRLTLLAEKPHRLCVSGMLLEEAFCVGLFGCKAPRKFKEGKKS